MKLRTGSMTRRDRVIKIRNRGFLLARISVTYEQKVNNVNVSFEQLGSLGFLTDYEFYLPPIVAPDNLNGAVVTLDVIWGPKYSIRVASDMECLKLTGLFFQSNWSRVECW
jgi:hypothetical protein